MHHANQTYHIVHVHLHHAGKHAACLAPCNMTQTIGRARQLGLQGTVYNILTQASFLINNELAIILGWHSGMHGKFTPAFRLASVNFDHCP